jgi:putative membrane protein
VPWAFAALTVATQVAYPLVHGGARDGLTVASVAAFCAASVSHAAERRGAGWALGLLGVAAGGGLLAEAVGVRTGVPFGSYSYGPSLGWRLAGVPVVVPLAWAMMAYPALLAGRRAGLAHRCGLARRNGLARRATTALTGGAVLATWDLFLDPQMVDAGHWRWRPSSGALGTTLNAIPLSNAVGWLAVATVLVATLDVLADPSRPDPSRPGPSRPRAGWPGTAGNRRVASPPNDTLPFALLGWTYASSLLANLAFFHRPAVALAGGVGMGSVLAFVAAGRRTARG